MRVGNGPPQWRRPAALWFVSLFYSILLLAFHGMLGRPQFATLLLVVAFFQVLIAASREPSLTATLLLTQGLVAVSSVAAILLYVYEAVGYDDTVLPLVRSFLMRSLKDVPNYFRFAFYCTVLCGSLVMAHRIVQRLLRIKSGSYSALSVVHAASAVNLACDYSIRRPLFHVSGSRDTAGFFFAAGVFGMEYSLPLFILTFGCCTWVYLRRRK